MPTDSPAAGAAGVTAIDAASGDGAAMPANSYGPSAYDLARAQAARPAPAPVEPAAPGAGGEPGAADPLRSADPLPSGG